MRYFGPTAKKGSNEHISLARKNLGRLKARLDSTDQSSGRWRRTLEDGSSIEVGFLPNTSGGDPYAYIKVLTEEDNEEFKLFLESGYMDAVENYYTNNKGAIYYTDDLIDDSALEETFLDYMTAIETKFDTREYQAGMDSISWTDVYTQSIQYFGSINYGVLSGKSKYFWQAGSGAKRQHDLSIMIGAHIPDKALSYGLYTTEDGDYYLIKVVGSQLQSTFYAAKINFTVNGGVLHSYLKTNYTDRSPRGDNNHCSLEGYLFAQAVDIDEWINLGSVECIEEPIHYSWNFNWDGDKAAIVTHEFVASGGDNIYITARHYRAEITEVNGVPDKVTAEVVEEVNWTPPKSKQEFWQGYVGPDGISSANWVTRGCSADWTTILGNDAPVYVYYDIDQEEIILRSFVDLTKYSTTALAQMTQWKKEHQCLTTKREGIFFDNQITPSLYMTKDGITMVDSGDDVAVQASAGVNGRLEKYDLTLTELNTFYDCVSVRCAGWVESEVDGYDWGSWPFYSLSSVDTRSYCNYPGVAACGYGTSQVLNQVTRRQVTGTVDDGSISQSAIGQFALFPFFSCEAIYMFGYSQYTYFNQRANIDKTNTAKFRPYRNAAASPSCSLATNGPEQIGCIGPEGQGIGLGATSGCTNSSTTDPNTLYVYLNLKGYLATKSEVITVEDYVWDDPESYLTSDATLGYRVFFEPQFILCEGQFTRHYKSKLVYCQDSAINDYVVYTDGWRLGDNNIGNTEGVPFSDYVDNFTGMWIGRS